MTASMINGQGTMQIHCYASELGVGTWNVQLWGRGRLSGEPIGPAALTFTGIKAGSELAVFDGSGNQLAYVASATNPQVVALSRYTTGDTHNKVRIFVASLGYENVDFSYTIASDTATIPVIQRIDRNYRNPA